MPVFGSIEIQNNASFVEILNFGVFLMKIIYLHIGIHKTGTTFLQNILSKNRNILQENGYYYPCSAIPNSYLPGHHLLPRSVSDAREKFDKISRKAMITSKIWNEILEELHTQPLRKIIISSEDFCLLDFDEILRVKEYLSDFRVEIIVYLRRQDEFLLSLYSELVKKGYYKSLEVALYEYKERFDYYSLLNTWANIFGKENLKIGIYRKSRATNNLFSDFSEKLDLHLDLHELKLNNLTQNPSINGKTIKILKFLNTITLRYLSLPYGVCQAAYLKRLQNPRPQKICAMIPGFLMNNNILSSKLQKDILEEFRTMNEKIAVEYFSMTGQQKLFL